MTDPTDSILYLVCIGAAEDLASLDTKGITEDARCETVAIGPLAAVVNRLPRSMFQGPDAEKNLADVKWLGPLVVEHDRIVHEALDRGPALPATFGAVFSTQDALTAYILTNAEAIVGFIAATRNTDELSLRVVCDRGVIGSALDHETTDAADTGRAYLEARRAVRHLEAEIDDRIDDHADLAADLIEPLSLGAIERRVVGEREDKKHVARHWAFLVSRDDRAGFDKAVADFNRKHAAQGIELEITGPWPPYSFCPELQQAGAAASETTAQTTAEAAA